MKKSRLMELAGLAEEVDVDAFISQRNSDILSSAIHSSDEKLARDLETAADSILNGIQGVMEALKAMHDAMPNETDDDWVYSGVSRKRELQAELDKFKSLEQAFNDSSRLQKAIAYKG